jgi:hypothetical protein
MLKYGKRLTGAAGVLATAGAVAICGLTAASASPAAHQAAARPAARAAHQAVRAATSGIEHFQLVTTSATARTGHVIARGVFTAPATDIMGNRTDTFKFSNGSFRVRHSPGHGPQSFNPRTCLVKVSQHGTYKLSHGTGKYAGIKGHGRYHVTVLAIGARNANGKCSQRKAPVAFQQIIKASGPVHR